MTATYCQSCGMPLTGDDVLGTEANGAKSTEYCTYCYQRGAFTQPNMSMEQMVEVCVPFMVQGGMEKEAATKLMRETLPHLKRWRQ
ncbi:MAG TPA: zinc ribbon domain-containing protein [Symbiobacteriaceae bacterium]|nr:zinc ribbon domain-containing protein [Symbiobacteriaceae bacterium]